VMHTTRLKRGGSAFQREVLQGGVD